MEEILKSFFDNPNNDVDAFRSKNNFYFREGYLKFIFLYQLLFDKRITLNDLNEVKIYYLNNQIVVDDFFTKNKYLKKYVDLIFKYWDSYTFYTGNFVRVPKYNLFDEIEKELQSPNPNFGYILQQSAIMKRNLEETWIASNQLLTKYEISIIENDLKLN